DGCWIGAQMLYSATKLWFIFTLILMFKFWALGLFVCVITVSVDDFLYRHSPSH
ncbi:MAG: hypothetical protein ACI92E_000946, partial [Oceanicoccus sp.]